MGAMILGIALLVALVFFLRWYATAPPSDLLKVLKWGGMTIGGLLVLFLLLRGGFQFLWIAAAFLIPYLLRRRGMRGWAQASKPRTQGQRSTVRTRFVAMELDHDTGDMDGEILEGPHRGRRPSDLDLDSLLDLLHLAYNEDSQSAQVIQSYLDRVHGDEWQERAGEAGSPGGGSNSGATPGTSQMTRDEAYEVLGLQPGAGEDEIRAAHRRLIREYHPDTGGSDYLAAKINEAKDLLLKD
ncbi:MAG: DnaJ domain-containing protein [Alphaproteobacteria bacterium]|nr:DnaJ domain-containing protein [Alphaproteobacteria bacterium]